MTTRTTAAITGMAVALAAGTATYMMRQKNRGPAKKLKQNTSKAIKTLGSVLDSVEYMMR